jgi:hypothetical protein
MLKQVQHDGSFLGSASRLAGLAGALLGWRPGEFWGATPEELAAILSAMSGGEEAPAGAADIARLKEMFPDG